MKIATWNIERPTKSSKRIPAIINCLKQIDADILVLTETNEAIDLGNTYNVFHSTQLFETFYKEGEKRVSIYTKYTLVEELNTFRSDTSICRKIKTPIGDLAVYGTIIGIYGNRKHDFIIDLDHQLIDFERIGTKDNLCICGDLNISFSDNYYYTQIGRLKLNDSFKKLNLINVTASIPENIDHIVLPNKFIGERQIKLDEPWNKDKKLSDHIGVSVTIL